MASASQLTQEAALKTHKQAQRLLYLPKERKTALLSVLENKCCEAASQKKVFEEKQWDRFSFDFCLCLSFLVESEFSLHKEPC
jgi:hypothetical protein